MTDIKNTEVMTTMPKAFQDNFFTVVPNEQRADYLPSQFNNSVHDSGLFERELFRAASYACDNNVILKWEMASVKSETGDTFFMYPSIDEPYLIDGLDLVDNKLFGLIVTLITLDEGSDRASMEQEFSDILTNHYHALSKAIVGCDVATNDSSSHELRAQMCSLFAMIKKHTPNPFFPKAECPA